MPSQLDLTTWDLILDSAGPQFWPVVPATSGWDTATASLFTHMVRLVGARHGQSALGMAPVWGCRDQGFSSRQAQGLGNLLQPGQALSPAPGAAWSATEVQAGSHGDK